MNKLGFAINYSSDGYGKDIICNGDGGNWTNSIEDIRDYLKFFNGLRGTNMIVTFISFDENGTFLTLLRNVSGRGIDFRAAWIYIPNEIEIPITDIKDAYKKAEMWLQKSISDTKSDIEKYFLKEYKPKSFPLKNTSSFGDKFGYRKLGHFSMEEILGSDIYQQYYDGYKAIFLLEKGSVTISDEYAMRFTDFTNYEIEKYCILMPPTNETLRLFGSDVQIVDEKGCIFDSPMRIKLGKHVQLCAKRTGFEDIRISPIEISKDITPFPLCDAINWQKCIDASIFRVVNYDGEVINEATITVCGTNITNNKAPFPLSEADAKEASVKVSANGFEDHSEVINVLKDPIIEIKMDYRRDYTIRMSNDKEARMTLSSKYQIDEIPLVGYTCGMDDRNTLVPSSWYKWKQRLIGIGMCLIVLFVSAGICAFDSWLDCHKFKWGIPPWQEINKSSVNSVDKDDAQVHESYNQMALVDPPYLDSTTTWHKDSLENHEETVGLFDALNTFDFSKIKDYKGKLGSSTNFMKIIDKIKETEGKGFDLKVGKEVHGGKYNSEVNKTIDINNYIECISSSHVQSPVSEPKTKSRIKGGNTEEQREQNQAQIMPQN